MKQTALANGQNANLAVLVLYDFCVATRNVRYCVGLHNFR